ncbi:YlzJ-like family protein [Tumebacillus permanentifrigoris]|uniref:YlzJ-like protein n=1 Tax=Tumebacillus permanentifrigoris TaxID=378543 RepID=A0A316DCK9_9BACL|nr:YlzJ-like family protein [Tumebacillus permanentifrigoris]PWK15468.1 YlzJ-like protein [Tumebacillus permanentifrigoris]
MLIWSAMPEEVIFEGMDTVQYNWIETEVQGVKMVVEPLPELPGNGRIVRLLCPKPASYLNPAFQPGQTINLF